MIKKAKSADLATLNKIVDTVFDEVETSMTNTTLLGLASNLMDYELAGTHGWPFELNTAELGGSKGDVVVPTDLETNVSELHEYLFGVTDYVTSENVQKYSDEIAYETGYTIDDAARVDNPLDTEDTTETEISVNSSSVQE